MTNCYYASEIYNILWSGCMHGVNYYGIAQFEPCAHMHAHAHTLQCYGVLILATIATDFVGSKY